MPRFGRSYPFPPRYRVWTQNSIIDRQVVPAVFASSVAVPASTAAVGATATALPATAALLAPAAAITVPATAIPTTVALPVWTFWDGHVDASPATIATTVAMPTATVAITVTPTAIPVVIGGPGTIQDPGLGGYTGLEYSKVLRHVILRGR